MYLKRFFVEGLAQAAYLFAVDGEVAVVDPKHDLAEAERERKHAKHGKKDKD